MESPGTFKAPFDEQGEMNSTLGLASTSRSESRGRQISEEERTPMPAQMSRFPVVGAGIHGPSVPGWIQSGVLGGCDGPAADRG